MMLRTVLAPTRKVSLKCSITLNEGEEPEQLQNSLRCALERKVYQNPSESKCYMFSQSPAGQWVGALGASPLGCQRHHALPLIVEQKCF